MSSSIANKPSGLPDTRREKWWKLDSAVVDDENQAGRGQACPKCYLADLDFDTLFRLHCPNCGFIAECGAFT